MLMNYFNVLCAYSNAATSESTTLFGGIVTIVLLLILLAVAILPYIIVAKIAQEKGFSVGLWLFLTWLLSWIAVIIVCVLDSERKPTTSAGAFKPTTANHWTCTCGATNSIFSKTCSVCFAQRKDDGAMISSQKFSPTEKIYAPYTCSYCGETIRTKRCAYCGRENIPPKS